MVLSRRWEENQPVSTNITHNLGISRMFYDTLNHTKNSFDSCEKPSLSRVFCEGGTETAGHNRTN